MHIKKTTAILISAALIFRAAPALAITAPTGLSLAMSRALSTAVCFEKPKPAEKPNNNYVEGCRYAKPIPDIADDDTSADWFFENSIFAGDSLMQGFALYCQKQGSGFLGGPTFLASQSFSLWEALTPVTSSSLHPAYQGEKMLIEDAIAKAGAPRAFLFFGTNDLVHFTPEETEAEYNDLIYRIHQKSPDTKLYIIGTTYIRADAQRYDVGFTNENLRKFNDAMYQYSLNYDYIEFINIGDRLIGADDGLKAEYCSDGYVHMSTEGYNVWTKVLRAYANYFIELENTAD